MPNKGDTMTKHLYEDHKKEGRIIHVHSPLCWCQQSRMEILNVSEHQLYRMMYPAEAGDENCRCDEPLINPPVLDVCFRCRKPIEE